VQAAVLYGDSFLARKEWPKAEQVYTAMMKQMPKSPAGYFKMGLSRKFQGKPSEAAGYFSQAIERNPGDVATVNEYIFVLAASKQADKAKKVLDENLAKNPKNPLLWETAGRFRLALREQGQAENAFLKAIELAPDYTQPYYQLGVLYAAQKKLPEAEEKFRKVVEKDGRNVGAHTLLGVVQNSLGKIEEANKHYRRALEIAPRNALAANNLASNLSDHGGNLDEALKFAQIARESVPEDPNVADTLGWIYYKKGLIDTAYPLLSDASRKLEKNAVVRYHHGMALSKKGKTKEAAAELKAALALDGKFQGAAEAKKALAGLQ
jgi:tetratricopeptide (TPR) repeat protein